MLLLGKIMQNEKQAYLIFAYTCNYQQLTVNTYNSKIFNRRRRRSKCL